MDKLAVLERECQVIDAQELEINRMSIEKLMPSMEDVWVLECHD